jgi:hypothetical protein
MRNPGKYLSKSGNCWFAAFAFLLGSEVGKEASTKCEQEMLIRTIEHNKMALKKIERMKGIEDRLYAARSKRL